MKLVQFIYRNNVIAQQNANMFLNQIEELKFILAEAYNCLPDEIETNYVNLELNNLSIYDVDDKGIITFNSGYPKEAKGILCDVNDDSDEFIDVMNNKNVDNFIEKHLHFKF